MSEGTWICDCKRNLLKDLDVKPCPSAAGVVYSPAQGLFYLLDGHGCRPQEVWVSRCRPGGERDAGLRWDGRMKRPNNDERSLR